jgi:hypothetical protein
MQRLTHKPVADPGLVDAAKRSGGRTQDNE